MKPSALSRRSFISSVPVLVSLPYVSHATAQEPALPLGQAELGLHITEMELIVVRATARTNWIFLRLKTNEGLTGLGEVSMGRRANFPEVAQFFDLIHERSPFEIQRYRQRGREMVSSGSRELATAFSAVEQAQWDLVGKSLRAPLYQLTGGSLRSELPVYANINRATSDRSPEGFAENAQQAVADGFRAIKAAPFDGFPSLDRPATEINTATELGIACIEAMRNAIGPDVDLKIDAHSNFDVPLAIKVAQRLEPQSLSWYEEPVPPTDLESTKAIKDKIRQPMAGGEFLFGVKGFEPLCQAQAVDIIMPDVKHCGGVTELQHIATIANLHDVLVSPHNPSGPVSTAASVQLCVGMSNFAILEYQWNEVPWRSELIDPPERFSAGMIQVPDGPGFGVKLNESTVRAHG